MAPQMRATVRQRLDARGLDTAYAAMPQHAELQGRSAHPERSLATALSHGARQRCPSCGSGALYAGYLKVADRCGTCGTELHHQRADDAPPYFTMFIVGHVVVAGLLALEQSYAPPTWVHLVIWLPLTLVSSLWLLPRIKGALIGLQWAKRMHGFGAEEGHHG